MPDFVYLARNPAGASASGTLAAANEREVMNLLDQQGLFPVKIEAAKETVAKSMGFGKKIKPRVLATVYGQLADLLHSGVPLLRSLEILERQSHHPHLTEIVKDIRTEVADGTSLADAFARHPKVFGDLTVSMVRAGQEGGFLEDVLKRIAEFTDHQEELKSKVVGALAYPVFLSIIGGIIVMGLIIFLVPKFEEMFKKQRETGELPFLTIMLLDSSNFMWDRPLLVWNVVWLALGFAGAVYGYLRWADTESGREAIDRLKLRIPGAGRIYLSLAVARFCRILGTLLHNGIPILTSLKIAKDSTGNRCLTEAVDKAAENVKGGQSLGGPLAASGYFPTDVIEMIAIGEESNTLERVLVNIADSTERRTTRQLDLLVRLLEPVMLLMMAAVTLVVVLALLLPFLNMGKMVG